MVSDNSLSKFTVKQCIYLKEKRLCVKHLEENAVWL